MKTEAAAQHLRQCIPLSPRTQFIEASKCTKFPWKPLKIFSLLTQSWNNYTKLLLAPCNTLVQIVPKPLNQFEIMWGWKQHFAATNVKLVSDGTLWWRTGNSTGGEASTRTYKWTESVPGERGKLEIHLTLIQQNKSLETSLSFLLFFCQQNLWAAAVVWLWCLLQHVNHNDYNLIIVKFIGNMHENEN